MSTISQTLQQVIRRIAGALSDDIHGTVTGGSTTTATMTGEPALLGANALQGAELTTISSTNVAQSSRVTAHGVTTGVATLTVGSGSTVWTLPTNGDGYEIHRLNGRGYTRAQYITAINAAIMTLADQEYSDLSNISMAIERGGQSGTGLRYEYPMPSGFNWLWGVDFLAERPLVVYGSGNLKTYRRLGQTAAVARVGQGFQLAQDGLIGMVAVYMSKFGTPVDNLTCVIANDDGGVPSVASVLPNGSASVAVTGSAVPSRWGYCVFTFDPPVLLDQATQYHWYVKRSGAADGSNYYFVGDDTAGTYGDGGVSTYDTDALAWTAVPASDAIFAVCRAAADWIPLAKANWNYLSANSDVLRLRILPSEGTPLRLRGGGPIATVSAETDVVPCRPDYVEAYAKAWLAANKAGRALPDNFNQQMAAQLQELGIAPPARRSLPANSVRIR